MGESSKGEREALVEPNTENEKPTSEKNGAGGGATLQQQEHRKRPPQHHSHLTALETTKLTQIPKP